ncbi:MAG: hypothetical protein KF780_02665 [Sphingomonas sp.]|nr:hypothetical protein [Sphingomonas sp.]
MPPLNLDALAFAVAWAALALLAGMVGGFWMGGGLALALLVVVMPLSAFTLSKTGDFALERKVRWAMFAAAALGLIVTRVF